MIVYVCMYVCLFVCCMYVDFYQRLCSPFIYSQQVKFQSYICKVFCALRPEDGCIRFGIAWKSSDSTSASRAGRETGLCNAYSTTSGV